ncbi:MAG TPA: hypothetical protein VLZ54_07950 [Arenibacter sp.]|nr:hypothetical protein [Arenibacter sp.]
MNIPQLHTNLFWDLSCLILLLTGLYFGCILFFRSPFWKSIATAERFSKLKNPEKSRILPINWDLVTKISSAFRPDHLPQNHNLEKACPEMGQGKAINDIEVDYEVQIDPGIEKQIHEILESYAKEHREKESVFYTDKEADIGDRMGEDRIDFGNIALPAPKFYSKKENRRVKLLYAIAELGDAREVPLLQGMLDQERNHSIAVLIKEIILGFLSERPDDKNGESEAPEMGHLCEHYVYKYLFQAIDAESQHLLLDEILKIGGQEELNFLRTLIEHRDESIREKASSIVTILEQKLHQKDILHVDFELTVPGINDQENNPDRGGEVIPESSRIHQLKQLIPTILDEVGKIYQKYK